ncbi:hypothetical protein GC197_02915 [bacterium]|nr:hypothetical protein [bacterium]
MRRRTWIVMTAVYLLLLGSGIWGLFAFRDWVLTTYATPAATENWNDFRESIEEGQSKPHSPVKRPPRRSEEPPFKVLFSKNFGAIVLWSSTFLSILYWSVGIMMAGALRTPSQVSTSPDDDVPP